MPPPLRELLLLLRRLPPPQQKVCYLLLQRYLNVLLKLTLLPRTIKHQQPAPLEQTVEGEAIAALTD